MPKKANMNKEDMFGIMEMLVEEGLVEQIYLHGEESEALAFFVVELSRVCTDGRHVRTRETWGKYEIYVAKGEEAITEDVRKQIGEEKVIFIENRFPYDALMPEGGNLAHMCLWNRVGEMNKEEIEEQVDRAYPGCAALVFENTSQVKSVPGIWHVHVVVDLAG